MYDVLPECMHVYYIHMRLLPMDVGWRMWMEKEVDGFPGTGVTDHYEPTTLWVLGIKLRSSAKVSNTLNG